jgi:hypothetical protein
MPSTPSSRAAHYAAEFMAAHDAFHALVKSLTDEQWLKVGANHPRRINDEDENRTVGLIAHHVAVNEPVILGRIVAALEGKTPPPLDFKALNAAQATQYATVTRDEVVKLLQDNRDRIAEAVAAISDAELDTMRETAVGPMSAGQRFERVLIGHIQMHMGSIQAAIA